MHNQALVSGAPSISPCATPALNVLIIYEDARASERAAVMLASAERELARRVDFRHQLWRFDFLACSEWRALATVDLANADLLVVSTSSAAELPPVLQSWLQACLVKKRGTTAGIVALLGSEDNFGQLGSARVSFVERAAKEAGLYFFSSLPCPKAPSIGQPIRQAA